MAAYSQVAQRGIGDRDRHGRWLRALVGQGDPHRVGVGDAALQRRDHRLLERRPAVALQQGQQGDNDGTDIVASLGRLDQQTLDRRCGTDQPALGPASPRAALRRLQCFGNRLKDDAEHFR